ncbi:ATP-binding protein [Micromonospora siamensis]|uniref:ATP-binding protein n=1 Tax=Micromonospora siamensis TaxID=299152 RepID=UPI0018D53561|nr:ATP-binding protein [Micromonospora siamensis]
MSRTVESRWDREARAEQSVGTPFDFTECVREQIHLLGGVQSYGALVAVRDSVVAVASSNTGAVLGVAPAELVGTPLSRLLSPDQIDAALTLEQADTGETAVLPVTAGPHRRAFDLTLHRVDGRLVLEFEPAEPDRPPFTRFYTLVRQALTRLQRATSVTEACQAAVREVRAITGYDRVVAYRFETLDGPGEVVAEDRAAELEPWLGLWFPATDIPPQARRLYERNWIRVIADVEDPTASLTPPRLADTGAPLDLSRSVLRTVSPFHLEYLRNIGVASSMSVSLLAEERLWGLIACHGRRPRRLGAELRSACEFFGVALSLHLAALRARDEAVGLERGRAALARATETMADALPTALLEGPVDLLALVDADSVVVRLGDETAVRGAPLPPQLVDDLWAGLPASTPGRPWSSDHLAGALPGGWRHDGQVSGALVLPLSRAGDCIAWLRRERTVERRWAADPGAPVVLGPNGERLTPRGSAAVFLATVRGHSRPWTVTDATVATELGRAVTDVILRHAAALAGLNRELSRINLDLESFAHVAAHDLKEPLRGIANAATFILEDAGSEVDEVTLRRLRTVERLAVRMDELLNSLLYFARVGQTSLRRRLVDLRTAVEHALEIAGPRLRDAAMELRMPERGAATVDVDLDRFAEILVNLLVNAAKYAREEQPRWVAVEMLDAVPPGATEPVPAVAVTDNGIGVPAHLRGEVFQLFRRLHPQSAHGGGSGAGLAIVKRLVERHGGQVWISDGPEGGTSVRLTLPAAEDEPRQ